MIALAWMSPSVQSEGRLWIYFLIQRSLYILLSFFHYRCSFRIEFPLIPNDEGFILLTLLLLCYYIPTTTKLYMQISRKNTRWDPWEKKVCYYWLNYILTHTHTHTYKSFSTFFVVLFLSTASLRHRNAPVFILSLTYIATRIFRLFNLL